MKWYKPKEAIAEIHDQSKMLAGIAILALGLSLLAIIIVLGKDK